MDYDKLFKAIKRGSSKDLDSLYKEVFQILCSYLRTTMGANLPDAEECAQHALVSTLDRIWKNAIQEPENIYFYLLKSAKNRYYRMRQDHARSNYQHDMEPYVPVEEQIDSLVSQEEQDALEQCLDRLDQSSREFINYWIDYPGANATDVAKLFGISVNNVWIKKHRIIKKLTNCIQKKLNK